MSEHILVISPCIETNQNLSKGLRKLGFLAVCFADLVKPSSQEKCPSLCIVDLQLSRCNEFDQWQAWLQDCLATRTACLAFDRQAQPDRNIIAMLGSLGDTLADPHDHDLLERNVHHLFTICDLTRQLDVAHKQLSRYQKEFQDTLQSAEHIQRSLIPTRQPSFFNLHYAWRYIPCKQVGGDLFNIVQLDEQTVMTYLIDVSGHGISSAMVTVSVHQSLSPHTGQLVKKPIEHSPFYEITSPKKILQELEKEYPFERFEEFFTISYMLINPHTGQLRYSNAGHPPPLLLRSDGSIERLDEGGTIIGVGELVAFEEGENRLTPGDRLFMYTDGITEHLGQCGELFGEERFVEYLRFQSGKPLDCVTEEALITIRKFGCNSVPLDDVTLVGMEFR